MPQQLAGARLEGTESVIVRAADEHQTASRRDAAAEARRAVSGAALGCKLHAIDLAHRRIVGKSRWVDAPQLATAGVAGTGTPSLGGSIATSSGLVFIGGTNDHQFHAFDARTGKVLWHSALPASGHATPSHVSWPEVGPAVRRDRRRRRRTFLAGRVRRDRRVCASALKCEVPSVKCRVKWGS